VSVIYCSNLFTHFIYLIRVYSFNCVILELKQVIKCMGCVSNVEKDWTLGFRVVDHGVSFYGWFSGR